MSHALARVRPTGMTLPGRRGLVALVALFPLLWGLPVRTAGAIPRRPTSRPPALGAASAASGWLTTAPLDATGPEDPEGGVYGLVHPRQFMLAAVPVSFGFTTSDARWTDWGSSVATGTGKAEFNVIMSSPEDVSYTLTLSRRVLIRCVAGRDHYSYETVRVLIPDYMGSREEFSEQMHAGCSRLRSPLA